MTRMLWRGGGGERRCHRTRLRENHDVHYWRSYDCNKKAVLSMCAGRSYKRITVRPSAGTDSNVLLNYLKTNAIIVLVAAKFQWNGIRENFQQTIVFGLQRIKFHHVACFFSLLHLRCILQYGLHTPVWKLGKKWPKKWLVKSAAKLVTNKNLSNQITLHKSLATTFATIILR